MTRRLRKKAPVNTVSCATWPACLLVVGGIPDVDKIDFIVEVLSNASVAQSSTTNTEDIDEHSEDGED
jgi:hypothetical protein